MDWLKILERIELELTERIAQISQQKRLLKKVLAITEKQVVNAELETGQIDSLEDAVAESQMPLKLAEDAVRGCQDAVAIQQDHLSDWLARADSLKRQLAKMGSPSIK